MQIIRLSLISLLCLLSYKFNNFHNNKIAFQEAYLAYYDNNYHFNFKKLETRFDSFEVFVNSEIIFEQRDIKNITSIPLYFLKEGNNRIDFYMEKNKVVSHYQFDINLIDEVLINEQEDFSLNSMIDDYDNLIEFYDEQYFDVLTHEYEITGNCYYLNIEDFISFTFNDDYLLCEKIELIIYNENLFRQYDYQYGYHFVLKESKLDNYHLEYVTVDNLSKKEGTNTLLNQERLYFDKELNQDIIDCKITFVNLYQTNINLSFEQVVDVNSFFLDDYHFYIKDI